MVAECNRTSSIFITCKHIFIYFRDLGQCSSWKDRYFYPLSFQKGCELLFTDSALKQIIYNIQEYTTDSQKKELIKLVFISEQGTGGGTVHGKAHISQIHSLSSRLQHKITNSINSCLAQPQPMLLAKHCMTQLWNGGIHQNILLRGFVKRLEVTLTSL